MAVHLRPSSVQELTEMVAEAVARRRHLALTAGGTKDGIGAPAEDTDRLDMRGFAGIVDYDPAELVLTARAGTKLAEVEALLAGQHQMLAFEPFDHGCLFGQHQPGATLGGIVAAGVCGARRVSAGAVRDHLLGFAAVSGRAESFVGGAKVVKNVTGYDLPKLACGSWGRLFALTEVTFKVLPRPRESATRVLRGLSDAQAIAAMGEALGSQAGVAAATHLSAADAAGLATTAFRIEGFGPSVAARLQMLDALLAPHGPAEPLDNEAAATFWRRATALVCLGASLPVWRIAVPPRGMATVLAAIGGDGPHVIDWGGALAWVAFDGDPAMLRASVAAAGGHAMLVRGDPALRRRVPALHPQPGPLAALEARVRRAFDPHGIFETGRFA